MIEFIEKSMMTAIGAVTLSQKKAEELIAEMRQKLNISEEEGKAFLNKLQESAKENQAKLEQLAQDEVKKACERAGLVSTDEFEKLKKKVATLEKKLRDATA